MDKLEISKLRSMLKTEKIPYSFCKRYDGFQLCYPSDDGRVLSCIYFNGSYGYAKGLLEIQGLLTLEEQRYDSVVGSLTAEDVFCRIKKHWDNEKVKQQ